MQFEFHSLQEWPSLAWCARLAAGGSIVRVVHGDAVETWPGGFCEGAWDGAFEEGAVADAVTLTGSGGCVVDGGVVFASPTTLMSRLYSIAKRDQVFISNSMVCLLALTGDALDVRHPHYFFDILGHKRRGLTQPTSSIRTVHGQLFIHQYTNLLLTPELSLQPRAKRFSPPPRDFADYRAMLRSGMTQVFANAADPRRKRRYKPLATLSQGYDAPAIAALAVEAGCTDGLAGTGASLRTAGAAENGTLVGNYLGLNVAEYPVHEYGTRSDMPEAEFCAGMAFGSYVPLSVVEQQLSQRLLLTGHPGDDIWSMNPSKVRPHLVAPRDRLLEGSSMIEFRLRVGFNVFAPAWMGAVSKDAIYRITTAPEMRPWSIGGPYDRPIPRRLGEEAGVPRHLFGQIKMQTFHSNLDHAGAMTERGFADFAAYCRQHRLAPPGPRTGLASLPANEALPDWWRSPFLFTFHWGVERIRSRYVSDRIPSTWWNKH